jgi:hypothetical protein
MTGQTRRKPSVPAPAPQRTAATHASGVHEYSYRFSSDAGVSPQPAQGMIITGAHSSNPARDVIGFPDDCTVPMCICRSSDALSKPTI